MPDIKRPKTGRPSFRRRRTAPLALALLGALGACGPINRGIETTHQPVVSRADYAFDVAAGDRGLAPGEAQRLDGWFGALKLGYGDTITLDDPAPYGHPGSRDAIATVAAHYGMLLGSDAPVTQGEVPAGSVRVVVGRASARVDACPDWDRPSQPELAAATSSNFGCAVNGNLAAMIANPQDLVRGQAGSGVGDAAVSSKAINAYRSAEPTGKAPLKAVSTGSGSGS